MWLKFAIINYQQINYFFKNIARIIIFLTVKIIIKLILNKILLMEANF